MAECVKKNIAYTSVFNEHMPLEIILIHKINLSGFINGNKITAAANGSTRKERWI